MAVDISTELAELPKVFVEAESPKAFLASLRPELLPGSQQAIAESSSRIVQNLADRPGFSPRNGENMAGAQFMKTCLAEAIGILNQQGEEATIDYIRQSAWNYATCLAAHLLLAEERFQGRRNNFWQYIQKELTGTSPVVSEKEKNLYAEFVGKIRNIIAPRIQGILGEIRAYRYLQSCGLMPELPTTKQDLEGIDLIINYKGDKVPIQVKTEPSLYRFACWFPEEHHDQLWLNLPVPFVFDRKGLFNPESVQEAISLNELEKFRIEVQKALERHFKEK